jgi:hypothetical protein
MVIICTSWFNIQTLCILPTQCIYVFHMNLAVNCHYFPKHQPTVLCNGDAVFSLRCRNRILISYLNQRHSSNDRVLAQAVSRRSVTAEVRLHPRSVRVPSAVHNVALCAKPPIVLTAVLTCLVTCCYRYQGPMDSNVITSYGVAQCYGLW